jgi:CheY-like chemotaxis protein
MPSSRLILVIDDEAAIARGLSMRLEDAGYRAVVCADGLSGLDTAREQLPDGIILDINLPTMDGTEFIRRLRDCAETRGIPVVVLSGSEERRGAALAAGANSFLLKPYEREAVLFAIRSALELPIAARRPQCQ